MGLMLNLIMIGMTLPVGLILIATMYPKNWRKRKMIYGIRNRETYTEAGTAERIDEISAGARKKAFLLTGTFVLIGAVLAVFHDIPLNTTFSVLNVYVYILLMLVPFMFANRSLKALKRERGLSEGTGVTYTDLTSTQAVHALKMPALLLPCLVVAAEFVLALLLDRKLITVDGYTPDGTYTLTAITLVYFITALLMIPIARMMDRQKNEVISEDSTVNANYNRAVKKCLAGMSVAIEWSVAVMTTGFFVGMYLFKTEMFAVIATGAFMVIMIGAIIVYVARVRKIDDRYREEMSVVVDDDDKWIFGMFYYNKGDKRLNVEKRMGVGATVNFAHPVGKVVGVLIAVALLASLLSMVWLGMLDATPIRIRTEDGRVICRQLRDEYKIEIASIKSVGLVDDLDDRSVVRTVGSNMPGLAKGRFTVDGASCKMFLNPDIDCAIRIETGDEVYYISGETVEETKALYEELK